MPFANGLHVIAVVSLLLAGCMRHTRVVVASPAGTQCVEVCRRNESTAWNEYECATSCPTARVEQERSCSAAEKPSCFEKSQINGGAFLLAILGLLVVGAVVVISGYNPH